MGAPDAKRRACATTRVAAWRPQAAFATGPSTSDKDSIAFDGGRAASGAIKCKCDTTQQASNATIVALAMTKIAFETIAHAFEATKVAFERAKNAIETPLHACEDTKDACEGTKDAGETTLHACKGTKVACKMTKIMTFVTKNAARFARGEGSAAWGAG